MLVCQAVFVASLVESRAEKLAGNVLLHSPMRWPDRQKYPRCIPGRLPAVLELLPLAAVPSSIPGGKLWRLRLYPPERLVAGLTEGMAGAHAGPHDVSGAQVKSTAFDVHEGFAAEREVQLFYRVIVVAARAAHRQLSAHHEEILRAEFLVHEAVDGKALSFGAPARQRIPWLEAAYCFRGGAVEVRCIDHRGPLASAAEERVLPPARRLRLRRRHLEPACCFLS